MAGTARDTGTGGASRPPTAGAPWTVTRAEAGARLDKFLAAPDRLGSRGKAADAPYR